MRADLSEVIWLTYLKEKGYWVRGVDLKYPEFGETDADEFEILDLRRWDNCLQATRNIEEVYALAADMGGMGFISANHAQILYNNSLINLHTLEAAKTNGVKRYLYTSSACIYPEYLQEETDVQPLKEEDGLSGTAAGRLRLGKTRFGNSLYALSQRLRNRNAHGSLS